jgi:peptidoglycan/xylan/chitin deacetylase (PgdA/CDA1 family)
MGYLKKYGFQTLSLGNVIRCVKQGKEFPEKGVVITFDDGYKNNYTHAFPIFKEYQFTAIIFLTTNFCGKTNNWPSQHPSIPSLPMLTWKEIREMTKYGIEFGAHTQSHPCLTEVDITIAQEEIVRSKEDIEAHLNKPVEFFSYPFGSYNGQVKEIIKPVFKGAISNIPGKVNFKSDRFALERINASSQIFKALPLKLLSFNSFGTYLLLKKAFNKSRFLRMK